mgnify:FL=1
MSEAFVAFIRREDEMLLLRRSMDVSEHPALWDGIFGRVNELNEESVLARVNEATGIPHEHLEIIMDGEPRGIEVDGRIVDTTPFLIFSNYEEDIEPRTLYTEAEWIDPGEIQHRNTTPLIRELYGDVASYIFIVKSTINQEIKVADEMRARLSGTGSLKDSMEHVFSILHPTQMRGYVFVEASARHHVENLIGRSGGTTTPMKNAKAVLPAEAPLRDVMPYLEPKSATRDIEIGTIVEISTGAFKNEKARVTSISETKEEVTMVLYEAAIPMDLTMRADHVRILERSEEL